MNKKDLRKYLESKYPTEMQKGLGKIYQKPDWYKYNQQRKAA